MIFWDLKKKKKSGGNSDKVILQHLKETILDHVLTFSSVETQKEFNRWNFWSFV